MSYRECVASLGKSYFQLERSICSKSGNSPVDNRRHIKLVFSASADILCHAHGPVNHGLV